MAPGRRPEPTKLKLIKGNPGRRPLNDREPTPPVEIPAPPELLQGEALAEWQRLTPLLREMGLISKLDRSVLVLYCQTWARYIDCETQLKTTGLVLRSPNGVPMYSPYWVMANKCVEQLTRLAAEMGLSPSARSRVKSSEPPSGVDPAEAFLSGTK